MQPPILKVTEEAGLCLIWLTGFLTSLMLLFGLCSYLQHCDRKCFVSVNISTPFKTPYFCIQPVYLNEYFSAYHANVFLQTHCSEHLNTHLFCDTGG